MRYILPALLLSSLFLLASCQKTYHCECTYVNQVTGDVSRSSEAIRDKKTEARRKCDEKENVYFIVATSVDCRLD